MASWPPPLKTQFQSTPASCKATPTIQRSTREAKQAKVSLHWKFIENHGLKKQRENRVVSHSWTFAYPITYHYIYHAICGAHIIPAYQQNSTIRFHLKEKRVFLKTGWEQQNQQGEVLLKFFFQQTILMRRPVCQYHETGAQNSVCHIDDRSLPWS